MEVVHETLLCDLIQRNVLGLAFSALRQNLEGALQPLVDLIIVNFLLELAALCLKVTYWLRMIVTERGIERVGSLKLLLHQLIFKTSIVVQSARHIILSNSFTQVQVLQLLENRHGILKELAQIVG